MLTQAPPPMAIQTHGFVPENECTVHYRLQFLFLGNIKCRSRACAPMTDAPTACFHEQCDGTSRSNIYIHQQTSSENTLAAECKDTFRLQASLLKLNVQCTTVLRKYKMPAEQQQCTCSDDRFNADRGSGGRWEKTRSKRNSTSRQPLIAFRTIYISLICDPTDRGYRNTINIRKWKLLLLFTSTASNELYESFREKRAPLMD